MTGSRSRRIFGFGGTCSATECQAQLRISDDAGRFLGVLFLYAEHRGAEPRRNAWGAETRGCSSSAWFESATRPAVQAAILFADLGSLRRALRRLSSRGYFDLIRVLTDLIDTSVVDRDGIVGKHAGDGGSALFLAADFDDAESAAARAAIEAARAIRDGAEHLGPDDVTVRASTSACTRAPR